MGNTVENPVFPPELGPRPTLSPDRFDGQSSPNRPSKTSLASPERLGKNPRSVFSNRTVRVRPDLVVRSTGAGLGVQVRIRMADATAPVPQASVSPSTPLS